MSEPSRIVNSRRLLAFPNASTAYTSRPMSSTMRNVDFGSDDIDDKALEASAEDVTEFLLRNQDFLDDFVLEHVETSRIQKWAERSESQETITGSTIHSEVIDTPPQGRYTTTNILELQNILLGKIREDIDLAPLLYEITALIGSGISADGISFFRLCSGGQELSIYVPHANVPSKYELVLHGPVEQGSTIAAYVAHSSRAVYLEDIITDDRFPLGVGLTDDESMYQSVICIPITLASHDTIGIMQFTRGWVKPPFSKTDYQLSLSMVTWLGNTVHSVQDGQKLLKQLDIEDNLMGFSRGMFDDITQLDVVSEKTMAYAKELVKAERCALFLVDVPRNELYSNLFDEGEDENGKPVFKSAGTIRCPLTKGIAGYVARSKEIVNIKDAYSDPRFNREVDKKTGFTTRNILCMPIVSKEDVIGVIQMINKKSCDCFSNSDVNSFKRFSGFCALALHYSKIYQEMQYKRAQLTVAMEQLSYHLKCTDAEADMSQGAMRALDPEEIPPDLDSFYFYPMSEDVIEKLPHFFVEMLAKLLGPDSFEFKSIWRFTLTVKKNYRPVHYHNWKHGFNVAHCMYCILLALKDQNVFSPLWMKGLMIGCLCHDVDHRGFNNAFMTKLEDPISQLYSTSTMEQHHYNHTVTILQQDNHDIFSDLSPGDYKKVLEYIRHAIFATDLVLFFPVQKSLNKLIVTGHKFDLTEEETLKTVVSLMMTACDLSAVIKPFPIQKTTVKDIYEEFYEQGDKEKQLGLKPINMMDRDFEHRQPHDQCGFISFVCKPCYSTLADIFPECYPLLSGCMDNFEQWQRVIEGKSTTMWEPGKSVPDKDTTKEAQGD